MLRGPIAAGRRRAHRTLALAAVCLAVAGLARPVTVAGQEEPPPEDPSTSSTTTTSEPPPTTVVLDDGDVGVVPPGSDTGDEPEEDPAPPDPGATPPPGEEPEAEPVVVLPDPTPGLNAALAAIDVSDAELGVARARNVLAVTEHRVREASQRRLATVRMRRDATRRAVTAQALVHLLVQNLVVHGNAAGLEPVVGAPSLDHLRDTELGAVVSDHLQDRLERARHELRRAVTDERAANRALRRARIERRWASADHLIARSELDAAIEAARDARRQLGPPILGPTVLDAEDLVAWYRTYYRADPPVAPIEELIDAYLLVSAEEGVTGDIAFAQAILETGGFRSQHARGFNFAGIGAYDSCAPSCGFRFAGLEAGVRAHIQLLRAYAEADLTSARLASTPDPRVRPEEVGVRGCCPRWTTLTGVWASDPNYDRKVLGIYRLMVETARARDRDRT